MMRSGVANRALLTACGIAVALLPLTPEPAPADELEHLNRQTRVMRSIEALRDPEVTGSVGAPVILWIDVTRPTSCQLQALESAGERTLVRGC